MPPKRQIHCSYCAEHSVGSSRSSDRGHTIATCPLKKRDDYEIYVNVWFRLASLCYPHPVTAQNLPKWYMDPQWKDLFQQLLTRTGPLDVNASEIIKGALGGQTRREYLYTTQLPLRPGKAAAPGMRRKEARVDNPVSKMHTHGGRYDVEEMDEFGTSSSSSDEPDDIDEFPAAAASSAREVGKGDKNGASPVRSLSATRELHVHVDDTPVKKNPRGASLVPSASPSMLEKMEGDNHRSVSPKKLYVPESPDLQGEKRRKRAPTVTATSGHRRTRHP